DGTRLASASQDGTVKLWDAASGQELRTLKGHKGRVWSVAFSPDGTRLASASQDGTVKLWDAGSGQELRTLQGHAIDVRRLEFFPDGTRLALDVLGVAFSPDGTRLASAGVDGPVRIWDGRPLTSEVQAEQEARGLVEFLFSKGLVKTQVIESLR